MKLQRANDDAIKDSYGGSGRKNNTGATAITTLIIKN
jgi:hypothetical protein